MVTYVIKGTAFGKKNQVLASRGLKKNIDRALKNIKKDGYAKNLRIIKVKDSK